eukprot:Hpha_TRINITY_DN17212_c0_g1::TRINITY_DN17212_c0_g1_i1::g.17945::m.17945
MIAAQPTYASWRPGPGATWFPDGSPVRPPPKVDTVTVGRVAAGLRARSPPGSDVIVDHGRPQGQGQTRYVWKEQAEWMATFARRVGGAPQAVSDQEVMLDEPSDAQRVAVWGARRALLVGVDYTGQTGYARDGSASDIAAARELLRIQGNDSEVRVLSDDYNCDAHGPPTREEILDGLRWLTSGARAGDCLFFLFAGHGGRTALGGGWYEETLLPVDHGTVGPLSGSDLSGVLFQPLPPCCRLTAVIDCCRGGSPFDLPFGLPATARRHASAASCEHPRLFPMEVPPGKIIPGGDVHVLSSVVDPEDNIVDPLWMDNVPVSGGSPLIHALSTELWLRPQISTVDLLGVVRTRLRTRRGVPLSPQLACTERLDLRRPFRMDRMDVDVEPGGASGPRCRCRGRMRRVEGEHRLPDGRLPYGGGWECACCGRLGTGPHWNCGSCTASLCFGCAPPPDRLPKAGRVPVAPHTQYEEFIAPRTGSPPPPRGEMRAFGGVPDGHSVIAEYNVQLLRDFGVRGVSMHTPAGSRGVLLCAEPNGGGPVRFFLKIENRGMVEVPRRDAPYLLQPLDAAIGNRGGGGDWLSDRLAQAAQARTRSLAAPPVASPAALGMPAVGTPDFEARLRRAQDRLLSHADSYHRTVAAEHRSGGTPSPYRSVTAAAEHRSGGTPTPYRSVTAAAEHRSGGTPMF